MILVYFFNSLIFLTIYDFKFLYLFQWLQCCQILWSECSGNTGSPSPTSPMTSSLTSRRSWVKDHMSQAEPRPTTTLCLMDMMMVLWLEEKLQKEKPQIQLFIVSLPECHIPLSTILWFCKDVIFQVPISKYNHSVQIFEKINLFLVEHLTMFCQE